MCLLVLFVPFLSFCALAFVSFLLLHKDAVYMLSHIFLTARFSYGTLYLAFAFVGMRSAPTASMWALMKFLSLSFRVSVSLEEYRICFIVTVYILLISQLFGEGYS